MYYFSRDAKHSLTIVPIDDTLIAASLETIKKYSLRPGDAIHLASALEARESTDREVHFISSDRRLNQAAESEGFLYLDSGIASENEWRAALDK